MEKRLHSSLLLALICLAGGSVAAMAQVPEPTAKWTFENTEDLMAPSVGSLTLTPCVIPGKNSISISNVTDAGIITVNGPTEDNKAIYVPKASALKVSRAEDAEASTAYTIMMDIMVPDANSFNGLLQMSADNTGDGDLFTNKNQIGIGSMGYAGNIQPEVWYRVVFTYNETNPTGTQARLYLNGTKIKEGGSNVRHKMESFGFYLFCDEDGEKVEYTDVAEVAFWETPLTDEEVAELGRLVPIANMEIATPADLKLFAQAVNSGNETNGYLTADINMSQIEWDAPIGLKASPFVNTFDGQGHTITGFDAESNTDGGGLFGFTSNATIKDFTIYGNLVSNGGTGSGVVGYPYSSVITGIHSYLDINVPVGDVHHVGGVVGSGRGYNTISGCTFHGSIQVSTGNNDNFAGVVAYLGGDSVSFCANYGTITFDDQNCSAGGVAAYCNNTSSWVQNCLNMGEIIYNNPGGEAPQRGGAIVGWLRSHDENKMTGNCWLEGSATGAGKNDNAVANLTSAFCFNQAQYASGEVCYRLNGDQSTIGWYQTLPGDQAPVLFDPTHGQVYMNGRIHCNGDAYDETGFSNQNTGITQDSHNIVDGFCDYCGLFDPDFETPNADGFYEIANAKQLTWFEMKVNKGELTANAILTADIDFADLMPEDADPDETEIDWTPIGDWHADGIGYRGHFDGQGHTIKNFNATQKKNFFGLFGVISDNSIIENFDIYGTYNTTFQYAGGVAAYSRDLNPTIRNVHSFVNINNISAGGRQGGILGCASVNRADSKTFIENCTYSGTLDGNDAGGSGNYGGMVGYANSDPKNIIEITNCLFDGEVVNLNASPGGCTFGGIVGYCNSATMTIKNCLSIGTVSAADKKFGQFFGALNGKSSTFVNCYYAGEFVNGTGSGAQANGDTPVLVNGDQLSSGEVCWKLNGESFIEPAWHQVLGDHSHPLPYGTDAIVYTYGDDNYENVDPEDPSSVATFINNVIAYEEDFIDNTIAYQVLLDEYNAKVQTWKDIETYDEFIAAYGASLELKDSIKTSAANYATYIEACEAAANYIVTEKLEGATTDILKTYLEGNEIPDEVYPNGSKEYILENRELDDDAIIAETAFVSQLLEAAIAADGIVPGNEITRLLTNASFADKFEGWTKEGDEGIEFLGGGIAMPLVHGYHGAFNVYQTVTGLPEGIYMTKTNALFSANDDINATFYAGQVYINNTANYVMATPEDILSVEDAVDGVNCMLNKDQLYDGDFGYGYVPNTRDGSSYAFNSGRYENLVAGEVGEDGSLTIGIRNLGTGLNDWMPFCNVHVYYLGTAEQADAKLAEVLEGYKARANVILNFTYSNDIKDFALKPNMSLDLQEQLDGVVQEVDGTSNKMALINRFSNLFNEIHACRKAYIAMLAAANNLADFLDTLSDLNMITNEEYGYWSNKILDAQHSYDNGDVSTEEALAIAEELNNCNLLLKIVDGVYQLASARDLLLFEMLVNKGEFTANAVLTADIDMAELQQEDEEEINWTPIGDWGNTRKVSGACYQGHFDGQGHTIKNLNTTSKQTFFGLFGVISSNCIIENFTISGTYNTNFQYTGGIAAYARDINPTIRNVHSCVNINNTWVGGRQGGILGGAHVDNANYRTTIENCTYSGTLDGNDNGGGGNYGGIVGYCNNNANNIVDITNCLFDGEVVNNNATPGNCTFGGIVGYNNGARATIKNCLSIGTVRSTKYAQFFGALNGNNSTFVNNYYVGDNVNGSGSGGTAAGSAPVKVTAEQLASGEVCYKLNGDQSEINWYQTIGIDAYPVLIPDHEQVLFSETFGYYNLVNDVIVGINEIESIEPKVQTSIYNLAGQRLNKLQKGLNIVNGKKILVK